MQNVSRSHSRPLASESGRTQFEPTHSNGKTRPAAHSGFTPPANRTDAVDNVNGSTYRSVAALAADIGLSERSTRSALRRGEIPHIRVGRRFILPGTAIAEWLRSAGRNRETEQGSDAVRLR
jgi:excisionase family DNA binding protein